eukprot:m.100794 g.100794  ORF g.100794 m.100794 type:complete len:113 (-) comp13723_c0_seq6:1883-2221(-)
MEFDLEKGISDLVQVASESIQLLAQENPSGDLEQEAGAKCEQFLNMVEGLQKKFQVQLTKLEEERTGLPPGETCHGQEIDTAIQAEVLHETLAAVRTLQNSTRQQAELPHEG